MRIKEEYSHSASWLAAKDDATDWRTPGTRPYAHLASGQKPARKAAPVKTRAPEEQVIADILFAFQNGEVNKVYWEIWELRNSVQNDHNWVWKGAQREAVNGLEASFVALTGVATHLETFGDRSRDSAEYVRELHQLLGAFHHHLRTICCELLPTARRFREQYVICAKYDVHKMAERAETITAAVALLQQRVRSAFACHF